jgi:hypothetical protein
MSLQARAALVKKLIFQNPSQRDDLLDPAKTQTDLIALLAFLTTYFPIEITSVRSDHRDDSALGLHCHANGYCADLWPLVRLEAGAYIDVNAPQMRTFLSMAAAHRNHFQTGLTADAYTPANIRAAGPTVFEDDGASHIHLGAT